jgi:uncharacterized protein involved in exopolysaccharide biosynthesis
MKEDGLLEELLRIFNSYKKFIILFNGTVFIVLFIYLLLTPKWYVGRATIIIADQNQTAAGLSSLQNFFPVSLFPDMKTDADRYFALINSRNILDKMIKKFDLASIYEVKYREDLYKAISEDINLIENDDGSITIECYYKEDPYKAAEMSNFLFDELKKLNLEISNNQGREFRLFLENIYNETMHDLRICEDSLRAVQENRGLYDIEEQAKQLIQMLGELELQKIQLETERNFLENYQNTQSSEYIALSQKIEAVQSQVNKITETNEYSNIPLKELPDAALTYVRLYRNLKIKEKILEFIVPQVEQARLEEKKNTTDIYLLDRAIPQLRKAKPKRLKLLIIYMLVSVMVTYVMIKIKEMYEIYKVKYKTYMQND